MSTLETLKQAARQRGFPIQKIWVDRESSMRFDAYESRVCQGLYKSFSKPFYPILLRWINDDGSRQMMKLEPAIDGDRFPREDWIKTGEMFLRYLADPA